MRRSPLLHPLAVLRTTIGLTQKEMGNLVARAARTIQAVELGKLPLSQDLAMLIARATGIDAGWLLGNDATVPPRKGLTAQGMGSGTGVYKLVDFEFHRAFMESPVASAEEMDAAVREAAKARGKKGKLVTVTLPVMKAAMLNQKRRVQKAFDEKILAAVKELLEKTSATEQGDIVRWRIRRFLGSVAKDI